MMITENACLATLRNITPSTCTVDLVFNGGTEVETIQIELDEPARIDKVVESLGGGLLKVETSVLIGEGGLKPFRAALVEMYPNVTMISSGHFDMLVAEQQKIQANLPKH